MASASELIERAGIAGARGKFDTSTTTHIALEAMMTTLRTISKVTLIGVTLVAFSGCADMTPKQRNTAIGAGVGAVGGAVLTEGSALGTLGGAAVGGVIGNVTTKGH
jgi:osmotically inducible lipoprotein OsmB